MIGQETDSARILVVSRNVWNDNSGTSSTLTNLFSQFDAENVAHIYIESVEPDTRQCYRFFQISEFSLIHKLIKWRTRTGYAFDTRKPMKESVKNSIATQEANAMSYVRGHRSYLYSFLREILWSFNGWKSLDLKNFVSEFNPDIVWLEGSPLPLMNKVQRYLLKITGKPASIFIQDDIYTYESCTSLAARIYKMLLRRSFRKVIVSCQNVFVISPKMKKEYDEIFHIESTIITKGVDLNCLPEVIRRPHNPIRLVYLGQVIYGRIFSLIEMAHAIRRINEDGVKMQMSVYTNNYIEAELQDQLLCSDEIHLMPPVPYSEVADVIANNDVVVYVESFEPRFNKVARLSFSTKITDYLSSGRCVFAVGPVDVAPVEYLIEEDAAIVVTSMADIEIGLRGLSYNKVSEYALKARDCAIRNHSKVLIDNKVARCLNSIVR